MTAYRHQAWPVHAVQWVGDNRDKVEEFFVEYLPEVETVNFTRVDYSDDGADHEHVVQFEAWGDLYEVEPGRWIVVHEVGAPVEVLAHDDFWDAYELRGAAGPVSMAEPVVPTAHPVIIPWSER